MSWMATRALVAALIGIVISTHGLGAQASSHADSTFQELRRDGNGFSQLASVVTLAVDRQTADVALRRIAAMARLDLTFDSRLAALATIVSIPTHSRTVAMALIEIADAAGLRVRVSSSGQLVLSAAVRAVAVDPSVVDLPTMVTEAQIVERAEFVTTARVGALSMTGAALRSSPVFVEPDVMRSVQALPGVEARSDYTAGFNVRGGESDQNLILIDGFPIYNPYHLGGMFSTFIDATVGRIDLRRGSLPAQFGGRLSGVLDVQSAEPARTGLHGTAEVSLLSSSASVGGAFRDNAGSWNLAARRTYVDAVVALLSPYQFPYHFQDVQGHLVRDLGRGVRLSTTVYHGVDESHETKPTNYTTSWGNSVVGVSLSKAFIAPRLIGLALDSVTTEQRVSVTRFDSHVDVLSNAFHASDRLTENRFAGNVAFHRGRLSQTFGYDIAGLRLDYRSNAISSGFADFIPFDSLPQRSSSRGVYTDQLWRLSSRVIAQVGVRYDAVPEARWSGLSPRLSLKYFVDSNTAITAGGGSYAQWMHSLGREEEPIQPLQFWVASDSALPVSRSRDLVAGIEHWFSPRRLLHVEGFHKRYRDVLRPNPFNDPGLHGDEFTPEAGTSYGIDVLARQIDGGRFSGWLAYTYAYSTRVADDAVHFYPPQDRRHNVNLVGSWRVGSNTIGAHVSVASGLPTTPVLGAYTRFRYDPFAQQWTIGRETNEGYITGAFDTERLPWYRRVDLSVSHPKLVGTKVFTTYLSVVNIFNFKNPASYMYDFGFDPRRRSLPNLPIAPTFGVKLAY